MNALKAAIVTTIAIFAWGFVFWWSPLPYQALRKIDRSNREDVMSYLHAQFPQTGVYMLPSPLDDFPNIRKLRETGVISVHVLADEDSLSLRIILLAGFVRVFLATFLAGWALRQALPSLRDTYSARFIFVLLIASALVVYKDLADPIWWYSPWSWNLVKALYDGVAWLISSLILSSLIHRSS